MIGVGDLRLGDIVQTKVMGENKLGSVSGIAIGTSRIFLQISDICNFVDTLLTEVEGVLLTPEILEKNGWISTHDSSSADVFCFKGKGPFYITLKRNIVGMENVFDFKIGDSSYCFGNKLKYVHELQHILWALGLNAEIEV